MSVSKDLDRIKQLRGAGLFVLLDPDRHTVDELAARAAAAESAGADVILVGSSLLLTATFDQAVEAIKKATSLAVVIFPGSAVQISRHADAILFLSLLSGRNSETLIGQHVKAAPTIHEHGLEAIATGYLLIESGTLSSIEFMSDTKPIPRKKPDIALAHVLAAQYLGMQLIYLEAGSGTDRPVPDEMIRYVSEHLTVPLIVGGGIKDVDTARAKIEAGADFVVVGNVLESSENTSLLAQLADAVHSVRPPTTSGA
ncbi:MAG: geranylgeranylglyceryl/heptaprenylglyceryl phosphate synthase [Candidatus Latescibacteria bacterium]|nr:geranylgeranylglyceryl/heptaprenylglyceryl phosphate synthase [Candidatus Latescibacterota bacterium]